MSVGSNVLSFYYAGPQNRTLILSLGMSLTHWSISQVLALFSEMWFNVVAQAGLGLCDCCHGISVIWSQVSTIIPP